MPPDLSRITFDAARRYSGVRAQQGRLSLDADWNEQVDVATTDTRAGRVDLVGDAAGPIADAGFGLSIVDGELRIGAGVLLVDGIRVENRPDDGAADVDYAAQPDLPGAALPKADGTWIAWLDVWEREVSAVEEPSLREVALGGPDTCTRTKVVWQVRLLEVNSGATCAGSDAAWDRLVTGSTGRLAVRLSEAATSTDPCVISASSAYRGLENQLYRVQVRQGDFDAEAASGRTGAGSRFVWSRENGSMVGGLAGPAVVETDRFQVQADRLGPGGTEGLAPGVWVEIGNDETDLLGVPGELAQVVDAQGATLSLSGDAAAVDALLDATLHPHFVRWDGTSTNGDQSTVAADLPSAERSTDGDWILLESGIEVQFSGGALRTGDHWSVAARTATLPGTDGLQLDWPVDPVSGAPLALPPAGIAHHCVRLGIVSRSGGTWAVSADCREIFPRLTELTSLTPAGGDGQTTRSGGWLPAPARVRVMRGEHPVAGAKVRFRVSGTSQLSAAEPSGAAGSSSIDVTTDAQGLAAAWWRIGAAPTPDVAATWQPAAAQQLDAILLDRAGAESVVTTRFYAQAVDDAQLVIAGGDGQQGRPGETLELALRARVDVGIRGLSGAQVRFEVMNVRADGVALDQYSGGSLHASNASLRVSVEKWPSGTRAKAVTVKTDADGVAYVQFRLGEDTTLTTQTVRAVLLWEGASTQQVVTFTSQLALASEIRYTPTCAELKAALTGDQQTVQAAIDALCSMIAGESGTTGTAGTWSVIATDESFAPMPKTPTLADIKGFGVAGRKLKGTSLTVSAELPRHSGAAPTTPVVGTTLVELAGTSKLASGGLRWDPTPETREWLKTLTKTSPVALRLTQADSEGRVLRQRRVNLARG